MALGIREKKDKILGSGYLKRNCDFHLLNDLFSNLSSVYVIIMNFKVKYYTNYGRNILIIKMTFDSVLLLRLFAVRASSGYFSTEEQNSKL